MLLYCRVLVLALLSWCSAVSAAETTLASVISNLCGGTAAMNAELTAKCDAAKINALEQAIQADAASLAGPTSSEKSISETAALQAQANLIKSALSIDSATLAAIKPGAATLPDMTAVAAAALQQDLQESARRAASVVSQKLAAAHANPAICSAGTNGPRPLALLFVNQEVGDLRKAYFQARDSTEGLREHIRNVTALLADFPAPATAYPPAPPVAGKIVAPAPAAPDGPEQTSFAAAVAGTGLVLDLVGKGAALAASFRPIHTSGSNSVTGDVLAISQIALVGELANLGYHSIDTEAIVAHAPATVAGSLRHELRSLRTEAFQLRQRAATLAVYDYVSAASFAKVPASKIGADGKPLSKTDQQTQEQVERSRLVAEATIRQALLTKTVADISTLTLAAEALNTMVFSGNLPKDKEPATPPLITAYDKWERMQLADHCIVTLTMKPGSAQVDKLAVQSAFGSPKYHYKVTGAQPWMLASERGEVLAAGILTTSASWERFGPSKD